jgi:hypothetical protein
MSLSGWIDRLDDWINPIVVKELRQAVKSRLVTSMLLLFLGVQILIVGLFLASQEMRAGADPVTGHAGNGLFMVLQAILLGTCMVLIPTYAAVRLSSERSDTNVDLLFISTLRPASIIAGKFFSALVLVMLVFSCFAPFMTFTYLLRGIDIPSILFVLGLDLLAVLLSTQVNLFLASIPAPRALKVFLFFVGFLLLCWIFAGLVALTSELIREGVSSVPDSAFWPVVGVTTLAILFLTGLFFCWSVALISPPSANRALMGRIFLVVTWLVLGAACLGLSWYTGRMRGLAGHHGPVAVWTGCSVVLFCVQFLVSINERESWGPRVARTIPRSWLLRPLAFLFYSGSAGGVLLSVLGVALTLLVGWGWSAAFPSFGFAKESGEVRKVFAALALYIFCYGISAVWLRTVFLRHKLRTEFTWVLVLLLVGLGSSLPWIVAFIVYSDTFGRWSELSWWLLANPFGAVVEVGTAGGARGDEFTAVCFLFLSVWALLLSALSLPWAINQVARFHPPARRVSGKAPGAAPVPEAAVLPTAAEAR